MVTFVEVDPATIDTHRSGRRGRVSYPLLKTFMERNIKMGRVDLAGFNKNPAYLRSVLTTYINNHDLPIKLFQSGGEMYLMRLDLNNDGTAIPGWKKDMVATEGAEGSGRDMVAVPLTPAEVDNRFEEEKAQALK